MQIDQLSQWRPSAVQWNNQIVKEQTRLQVKHCFMFHSGGAGPLVICSDCYDNANIYSRTREYCPYAYLEDDDPLDKTLPGLKDGFHENDQHKDLALQNLISNQNSSIFLELH